jgi:hypothetical protein
MVARNLKAKIGREDILSENTVYICELTIMDIKLLILL